MRGSQDEEILMDADPDDHEHIWRVVALISLAVNIGLLVAYWWLV